MRLVKTTDPACVFHICGAMIGRLDGTVKWSSKVCGVTRVKCLCPSGWDGDRMLVSLDVIGTVAAGLIGGVLFMTRIGAYPCMPALFIAMFDVVKRLWWIVLNTWSRCHLQSRVEGNLPL